jgi:hypothetical protein
LPFECPLFLPTYSVIGSKRCLCPQENPCRVRSLNHMGKAIGMNWPQKGPPHVELLSIFERYKKQGNLWITWNYKCFITEDDHRDRRTVAPGADLEPHSRSAKNFVAAKSGSERKREEMSKIANPLTSVKKPAANGTTLEPTRLSCAPPLVAASRLPRAFSQPESCFLSSDAFDLPRALGAQRPEDPHGCAP